MQKIIGLNREESRFELLSFLFPKIGYNYNQSKKEAQIVSTVRALKKVRTGKQSVLFFVHIDKIHNTQKGRRKISNGYLHKS